MQRSKSRKHPSSWLLLLLACFLLVSLGINLKIFFDTRQAENVAKHVYSHRGASGEEIEHTFAAYDLAIAYGSEYIEQDLVTSKDGTLFVSHDLSAKKITGVDKLYSDMLDTEIEQLRTADGGSILRLQDVFDRYKDSIRYVIELKENDKQTDLFETIIKKNNLENQVVVQSFSLKPLEKLSRIFPKMPQLFLTNNQEGLNNALEKKYVDIIAVNKDLMTSENKQVVHNHKKLFNVWTLNTEREIKAAIEMGVDTYFTNFTAKALLLEKEYRN